MPGVWIPCRASGLAGSDAGLDTQIHSLVEALGFGVAIAIQDLEGIRAGLATPNEYLDTSHTQHDGPQLQTT